MSGHLPGCSNAAHSGNASDAILRTLPFAHIPAVQNTAKTPRHVAHHMTKAKNTAASSAAAYGVR
jgi:hypothetical protein